MAITFPYQSTPPAQATSFGPQAPIPQVQQGPAAGTVPGPDEFEALVAKIQSQSPEENVQLAQKAAATGQPAPLVPQTVPQLPQGTAAGGPGPMGAGFGQVGPPQDDGTNGWMTFINNLADPEGASRFLLETGANILQPRPEQVSGASHVTSGLADSVGRLGQRRTAQAQARSQRELESAKVEELGARSGLYGQQAESQAAQDLKIPSEIVLNYARAFNERASGTSSTLPAAKVQQLGVIAEAILATAPDVYTPQTALLAAQEFINPDLTRNDFLSQFASLYAIMGGTEDISNQATNLADSIGLKGNLTLGDIEAQQAEATRPTPTQAEIDAANTTREGAMAYAMKYLGKSEEEARALVAQKYGDAPEETTEPVAAEAAAPAEAESENTSVTKPKIPIKERRQKITQDMKTLDRMSQSELQAWYEENQILLTPVQKRVVLKKLNNQ